MGERYSFKVLGMTCVGCVRAVERSIKKLEGVEYVSVDLATGIAFVIAEGVDFEDIKKKVEEAGYKVGEEEEDVESGRSIAWRLILAWIVSIVLVFSMVLKWNMIFDMFVSGFVVFFLGFPILRGAFIALAHFHANMDTLISLGAVVSWFTSVLKVFNLIPEAFAMVGSMMVAIHITGRFIETKLKEKAMKDLKSLMKLRSKEARILKDGKEIMVPSNLVKVGEMILVKPGEVVPVDGVVIEGMSNVDESLINGEPIPVLKEKGDSVTSGSICLDGFLKLRAESSGSDSFVSKMIELVRKVQGERSPIQALADRITNYFVPAVFIIATSSAVFWYFKFDALSGFLNSLRETIPYIPRDNLTMSLYVFVSSLVISCPCALGIATPLALVVGSSLCAVRGILVKSGGVFQMAGLIDAALLDKTGTLTIGKPEVVFHNLDEKTASVVASIERLSSHPLSKSLSRLGKNDLEVSNFREIPGEGVEGIVEGDKYFIGKPLDDSIYSDHLNKGRTVIEIRKDGEVVGFVVLEDPLRGDSKESVENLESMGIEVILVTGDNEKAARHVAEKLGIRTFHARLDPEGKYSILMDLKKRGKNVLAVGDGINDSAILKGADVGIAMERGTDIALESADVVIMRGGISKVVELLKISKNVKRTVRYNLFWAFFYNVLAIPAAAVGLVNPLIAEVAMSLSSITVILNSLMLRKGELK